MAEYRRQEAREWAMVNMKGVCGCMLPTFNNSLTAVNERAIRHDIRLEKRLGFWGTLLVSECGTTQKEMCQVVDIGVDEAKKVGLRMTPLVWSNMQSRRASIWYFSHIRSCSIP
jgi:hypothetical protein